MGTKKSNFVTKSVVTGTDTFDFVSGGQNFKITFAALQTALGVLGVLTTLGEVAGIPVLKITGTDYEIRNIIGGAGIVANLSAEDGVEVKHNFTVNSDGEAILINPTQASPTIRSILSGSGVEAANNTNSIKLNHRFLQEATGIGLVSNLAANTPEFKSLVAGAGINLTEASGVVTITYAGVPSSSKTVIVYEIGDFPTPVAGVITCEADTEYLVSADVSSANRFVFQEDSIISGADGTLITLGYTGSGVMFTSANASNKIKDIGCACASGTLLDISGTGADEIFQIIGSRITCDTIGDVDSVFTLNLQNNLWNVATAGLTLSGNNTIVSIFQNIGIQVAGTFLDFNSSTFDAFSLTNSVAILSAGATYLDGAAGSANVNAGGLATVLNTRVQGSGTALVNITPSDSLWEFKSNNGIPDSRDSLLGINAGTTVTIAVIDTPVILGATWTYEDESRFTGAVGGRFTYTGKGGFISFHASITADIAVGTKIPCTFYYFKNGVEITNSGIQRDFTSGNAGNFSMPWAEELETGDYIEIFAENNNGTANIEIENAIVRFD